MGSAVAASTKSYVDHIAPHQLLADCGGLARRLRQAELTDKAISPLRRRLIDDMANPPAWRQDSAQLSIVIEWSSGSSRARACPREGGGQEGSVRHSLVQPSRAIARVVARRAPEGMDAARPALAVSRLPRAAHQCAPPPPARPHRSGTRRHYQARWCSHAAAQLCHPSPGAKDRYPEHPGAARGRDILPANIRSRGGFTIRSIPGAARPWSL
jgi:hypothetical protein